VWATASEKHLIDVSTPSTQSVYDECSGEFFDSKNGTSGVLHKGSLRSGDNGMKPPGSARETVYIAEVAKVTTRFTEVLTGAVCHRHMDMTSSHLALCLP
jgi:hypothetical protein